MCYTIIVKREREIKEKGSETSIELDEVETFLLDKLKKVLDKSKNLYYNIGTIKKGIDVMNMITLWNTCPICGKDHSVEVPEYQFNRYNAGMSIQYAFPTLSADDREIIKTGICPKCWDGIFAPSEEVEVSSHMDESEDFEEDPDDYDDYDDRYDEMNYDPYMGYDFFECDECF